MPAVRTGGAQHERSSCHRRQASIGVGPALEASRKLAHPGLSWKCLVGQIRPHLSPFSQDQRAAPQTGKAVNCRSCFASRNNPCFPAFVGASRRSLASLWRPMGGADEGRYAFVGGARGRAWGDASHDKPRRTIKMPCSSGFGRGFSLRSPGDETRVLRDSSRRCTSSNVAWSTIEWCSPGRVEAPLWIRPV